MKIKKELKFSVFDMLRSTFQHIVSYFQFAAVEGIVTTIQDNFTPQVKRYLKNKKNSYSQCLMIMCVKSTYKLCIMFSVRLSRGYRDHYTGPLLPTSEEILETERDSGCYCMSHIIPVWATQHDAGNLDFIL